MLTNSNSNSSFHLDLLFSSLSLSPTQQSHTKEQLVSKLREAPTLALDEQKNLVEELITSHNVDINAVIDGDESYGDRLIDIAVEITKETNDPAFAVYLIAEKGADLKLCKAVYVLSPDSQTEERIEDVIDRIHDAIPLQYQDRQPQFEVKIQQSSNPASIALNLSLPEIRKLAQASIFFQPQWTSGHANFSLEPPPKIDLASFQNVIYVAIDRRTNTTHPSTNLDSLFDAVNYLNMVDGSPIMLALVQLDSLQTYISSHSPTLEERVGLSRKSFTPGKQIQIQQKQNKIENVIDLYVHMALYAKSDAHSTAIRTIIQAINTHPRSFNIFNSTQQLSMLFTQLQAPDLTNAERTRIRLLMDVLSKNNVIVKSKDAQVM